VVKSNCYFKMSLDITYKFNELSLQHKKKSTISLRTLEGVIIREGVNGEPIQITSKCIELDREMVTAFGVSTAILENVIFCHQEESNWPLSEGKQLKSKFDDIFAATKYMKALELIRKLRVEKLQTVKISRAEIGHLKTYRDMLNQKQRQYAEIDERRQTAKEHVENVQTKLQPIDNRLEFIGKESSKMVDFQRRMDRLTNECEALKKQIRDLKNLLDEPFGGSEDELKSLIRNFQDDQDEKKREVENLESKKISFERKLEKLTSKRTSDIGRLGALEFEERQNQSNQKRFEEIFVEFLRETTENFSKNELIDRLERRKASEEKLLMEKRSKFDRIETEIQRDVDQLKEQRIKIESTIKFKSSQIEKNLREIHDVKVEQKRIDENAAQLTELDRRIDVKEKEIEEKFRHGTKIDALKNEIVQNEKRRNDLQIELKILNDEIDRLLSQAKVNTEFEMFRKEKVERDEQIRKIKLRHNEIFSQIFNGKIPSNDVEIRREFDEKLREIYQNRSTIEREIGNLRKNLSTNEEKRRALAEEIRRKDALKNEFHDRLDEQLHGERFDEYFEKVSRELKEKQDEKGNFVGMEKTYRKFVEQLKKKEENVDPCCPLCYRKFDKQSESDQLVRDIESMIKGPEYRRKIDRDLTFLQEKFEKSLNLQPIQEQLTNLESNELPQLKTQLKQLDKQIIELKNDEKQFEEKFNEWPIDQIDLAKNDVILLEKFIKERDEFERKIEFCREKLGPTANLRSIDEVKAKKDEIQNEFDRHDENLRFQHAEIRSQQDFLQQLRENLTELKNSKLKLNSDVQRKERLDDQLDKLTKQIQMLKNEIENEKETLEPLRIEIEEKTTEKTRLVVEKDATIARLTETIDTIEQKEIEAKNLFTSIEKFENRTSKILVELRSTIFQMSNDEKDLQTNFNDCLTKISTLKNEIARAEIRFRQLNDQRQLFRLEFELEEKNNEFRQFEEKTHGFKLDSLIREEKQLRTSQDALIKEKHTAAARLASFDQQLNELKQELDQDHLKNAQQRYLKHFIQQTVEEIASQDLERFYKVLDQTMMTYHTEKMNQLNKIIRDLWRTTYRGSDIDAIEIRSDVDEENAMKTRRTYNYRVVMLKAGSVMDMRNRCSAGQKVLASLIIRLALAEAFCLNCGILALDEPTTNLDFENIDGLAQALIEIVKSRANLKNFQLIIITHDEDFVDSLGKSAYAEKCYRVSKSNNGLSKIDVCNISAFGAH